MIILLHVILALSSIATTTLLLFRPSPSGFTATYSLVGLTVASGTYVAFASSAKVLETCTMGLLYLVGVSAGIVVARRRFAAERS